MSGHRTRRVPIDMRGLGSRQEIFRVSQGLARDPAVDAWLTGEPIELRAIARPWFLQMRDCGDDVRELIHDGCPVACVENAPFGYVNSFKSHISVGFFRGAELKDPAGLLEGTGKRMRHVKLRPDRPGEAGALRDLIVAAYQNIKLCLIAEQSIAKGKD
jgi:hypothetical protein